MQRKHTIICLCGSTKYKEYFEKYRREFTLKENIVLDTGGVYGHVDSDIDMSGQIKQKLDHLHLSKIELSDEIFVINPDMRIGLSTCNEIIYALYLKKKVKFLNPPLPENEWEYLIEEFYEYCGDYKNE